MLAIEIRFPAGKYHATPWNRQVNEGAVEWPPSPWRILRALISTWYHKLQAEIDEETIRKIIEKLGALPQYFLPEASLGHTRHYMPLYRQATTMVIDTFAAIEHESRLIIEWPQVDLSIEEISALSKLLDRIGYLGRAESWIEARLAEGPQVQANCIPLKDDSSLQGGFEGIQTLAAMPSQEYLVWREKEVEARVSRRLAELGNASKLKKKDLDKIEEGLPANLFSALHADTGNLKKAGWSQPPGSVWVFYARPRSSFEVIPRAAERNLTRNNPTVARFAVASQVPPRLTDALSFSERIHLALVSRSNGSSVFTGCDESGKPLDGHRHASILCESNLGLGKGHRGEITHVVVHAPMGFELRERRALDSLTAVWGHGGHDIQLILLGVGQPEDFAGFDESKGESPMLAKSNRWISRTPFISTRHPKATKTGVPKLDDNGLQIGSAEHELRRLMMLNNFPAPISVEPVPSTDLAGHETRWLKFLRERNHGNGRREASGYGYGFRIKFPEKVQGPIALGYGAHFGLGLFIPDSP
ncbi:MAG: CRISPR-associated protein, family (Cas_GSU0054) [Methanosaeta sp. PtaU1.Bin112]|nr:MAG: CRISPR-associated protein, family (Cas_GSU0054) [Methanosaeta sp. PtaU1.Bin112]